MSTLRIALLVAKPQENCLRELRSCLSDSEADVFLLPEAYVHSDQLPEACTLARKNGKWLSIGVDDVRTQGKHLLTTVVVSQAGQIVGEHVKTVLTADEESRGYSTGHTIGVINTAFGRIGICTCYEVHFPEVARIYALQGARLIFNPIGTGMWDEQQHERWTVVARARATENEVFVLGCSHFTDKIPLAFAYTPMAECLAQSRNANETVVATVDTALHPPRGKLERRRPELYGELTADIGQCKATLLRVNHTNRPTKDKENGYVDGDNVH